MSMFRRPGEDTSSDDSDDHADGAVSYEENGTSSPADLSTLSRINTLGSTASGQQTPLTTRPRISRNNSNNNAYIQNLLLHSLLEDKTLEDAAKHLGKTDLNDPQVRALAQRAFQSISRQLSGPDGEKYSGDEMRAQRAAATEHLKAATQSHFTTLEDSEPSDGPSRALVPRNDSFKIQPGLESIFTTIPAAMPLPLPYPDLGLRTDRYVEEFLELGVVGKGGYGKVFKVKHKLDNSLYAVKRIMVSPARLQKIQENGPKELDSMLEEVRALAGFDHQNIVRYYNCWLEFSTAPADVEMPPTTVLRKDRLLEDAPTSDGQLDDFNAQFDSLSFGDPFQQSGPDAGADIVFEFSDTGGGIDDTTSDVGLQLNGNSNANGGRKRRASQLTIATISSTRSHMSAIPSVEDEDEEVETIPRSHLPHHQDTTSDVSQSLLSHSDAPNHLASPRPTGPILTLNVQMSLYDTNLADFISSEVSPLQPNQLRHCFHPCISLRLLSSIISGVEYLHDNQVVHRDLKPANVFLALSTSRNPPVGSINLASCKPCTGRDCIHVTPRIGDFGLVAALGDKCMTAEAAKPVGTQFYRPEVGGKISEKLDVFALGVVGFELLQYFSTRMERYDALTHLRRGELPYGFKDRIGRAEIGDRVQNLLSHMVHVDEDQRWSCETVQHELRALIDILHHDHD